MGGGGEGEEGMICVAVMAKPIQHCKLFKYIFRILKKTRINGKIRNKERDLGEYFILCYITSESKKEEKLLLFFLTNTYGTSTAVPCNGKTYLKKTHYCNKTHLVPGWGI